MQEVIRPQAVGKRINCYQEFELCYLRHKYLRNCTVNPSEEAMKPFFGVVRTFANKTYYNYIWLFKYVGLEEEDIVSIGRTHLVSFLGLYSVQIPEKLDCFIDRFIEAYGEGPEIKDILNKDKADFTIFLKQRMKDLVRVCRQKVKNIRGTQAEEYLVFCGPNDPPDALQDLVKNYDKFGFKKIDVSKFKSIKRKHSIRKAQPVYKIEGINYVVVSLDHRELTMFDFVGAGLDPYESIHNMNPEEIMLRIDSENKHEKMRNDWKELSRDTKNKEIREFIRANKNNPRYSEEVAIAKKMIKRLRNVR